MKKLALTVSVLAVLGLTACSKKADEANTASTNVEVTTENAVVDVNAAENATTNATDNMAAGNMAGNAQ